MFLSEARQPEWSFFAVLDNGFAQIFRQIVSMIVKTLRNTNFAASSCFKMKKTSLPVNVRRSKRPLFKLSIVPYKYVGRIFLTASLLSGRIHEAISYDIFIALSPLQRVIHVVQNRHAVDQGQMHWNKTTIDNGPSASLLYHVTDQLQRT